MAPLMLLLCLLQQPMPAPVHVIPGTDPRRVEVRADLPPGQFPNLPQGKLTQDQGEPVLWLALQKARGEPTGPAMFGDYERVKDTLIFKPRFNLEYGQRYVARFPTAPKVTFEVEYLVPQRKPTPPAVVENIFPSADVLPANHLRFHIHFSKPMRGGQEMFDHIKLLDEDGKEDGGPWLRDELWDATEQKLVLYIHPGRIKWGVLLRLLFGPVLEPQKKYTLVIGPGLLDINGQPLGKEFRKEFRTIAEDRVRIDLKQWKVQAPKAATVQPLVVKLPKPMDRVGLERYLTVVDAQGVEVKGRVEIGKGETTWAFHPAQPWAGAKYAVKVDEMLEDVAGNTPTQPFDVDLQTPKLPDQPLQLPFQPVPAQQSRLLAIPDLGLGVCLGFPPRYSQFIIDELCLLTVPPRLTEGLLFPPS